jgi:hypothetical protein
MKVLTMKHHSFHYLLVPVVFLVLLHGTRTIHAFVPLQTQLSKSFARASAIAGTIKKTIALVTDIDSNKQIILPGETRIICADDSFSLVQKSISDDHGVVAVGVTGEEREESDDLLEMASMCEIRNYDERGMHVTVECIGRIKLENFAQLHPYWTFYFSVFEEHQGRREECRLVADNIETLIKTISQSEQKGGQGDAEDSLLHRFKNSFEKSFELDHTTMHQSHEIRSLTAISWAAFIAVEEKNSNMNHYNYRMKALDYDTLFDRLKLAQYMLREKELRLQGMRMQDDPVDEDDYYNADIYQDGFQ